MPWRMEILSQKSPSLITYHFPHRGFDSGGALVGLGTLVGVDDVVVVVVMGGRDRCPPGGLET